MKIAFIISNLRGGGAEKAVLKIASILSKRGHSVDLILLENVIEHEFDPDFNLRILTPKAKSGFFGKRLAAIRLKKMLKNDKFDYIVSTLPFTNEIVHLAKLPNVWYRIDNTLSQEIKALSGKKAARRLARYQKLFGKSNLISVSQGVTDDLVKNLKLTDANILTISNPFDPETKKLKAAQETPDLPKEPYIIHVGRFAHQKRHDILFEAYKLLNTEMKLVLLVNHSDALNAMIAKYGLESKVIVTGFRKNPYPWIKNATLFVLSSDHEGMPSVLVEALLLGTKVVSTDCPSGPSELLKNLAPCGNPKALAEEMQRALNGPQEYYPEALEKFLPENVALAYEAIPK